MSTKLQPVVAVQDGSCHWYVIPAYLLEQFLEDEQNEDMINSGDFDDKYGDYCTGGDLNLIQLYAEI